MALGDFFKKKDSLVALDIGANSVKLVGFDLSGERPRLTHLAVEPLRGEVFSGNAISNPDELAPAITGLLEAQGLTTANAAIAMPAPSVFTKKIRLPIMSNEELASNIQLEAGNFIPHNIDAVKLDYHVLGEVGKDQLEVLVVAVKNEIVDSVVDCLAIAGTNVVIVDVDCFALQNIFEANYPELISNTTALINIGQRFSAINICRRGQVLFTGDVSIAGKTFTEAIGEALGVGTEEAEKLKKNINFAQAQNAGTREILQRSVDTAASEFNRQLSFFWSASGAEEGINRIMVSGGGSLVPELLEGIQKKTGIQTERLDPFRAVDTSDIEPERLKEALPFVSVAAGLALRQIGDKEFEDDQN